jgi:hypothetical protein
LYILKNIELKGVTNADELMIHKETTTLLNNELMKKLLYIKMCWALDQKNSVELLSGTCIYVISTE